MPLAITPTFSPWTHTSNDSYIYQLSLVLATATVSFNLSVRLSVCQCVCVTFVVFTDCENYTRPIFTNPGSMEAGEYGLTRGTRFVACRLDVVAVAGLLWNSLCIFDSAGVFRVFFRFFLFERTRPAASMRPPCLIYLLSLIHI